MAKRHTEWELQANKTMERTIWSLHNGRRFVISLVHLLKKIGTQNDGGREVGNKYE